MELSDGDSGGGDVVGVSKIVLLFVVMSVMYIEEMATIVVMVVTVAFTVGWTVIEVVMAVIEMMMVVVIVIGVIAKGL